MIIYRMALGKAATSSPRRTESGPVVSPLPFPSTTNNNSLNSALEFPMGERLPLAQDPEIMEERFPMERRLPMARDPEIMEERR